MGFIFQQSTGRFTHDTGESIETGYSGCGEGRCNPAMQAVHDVGPLPMGHYTIGHSYTDPHKGPIVMRLIPDEDNQMFGRAGFLIHGDNKTHTASEGCIILGRESRQLIDQSEDRRLQCIP